LASGVQHRRNVPDRFWRALKDQDDGAGGLAASTSRCAWALAQRIALGDVDSDFFARNHEEEVVAVSRRSARGRCSRSGSMGDEQRAMVPTFVRDRGGSPEEFTERGEDAARGRHLSEFSNVVLPIEYKPPAPPLPP